VGLEVFRGVNRLAGVHDLMDGIAAGHRRKSPE
jgi:hypothetical protein